MRANLRLAFLIALFCTTAAATTINVNVIPNITGPTTGSFIYSYSVTNDISSLESLFSFAVGKVGPLTSIISPAGWTADDVSTPGFIVWTSDDQSSDLIAGSTDLFGFRSPMGPGRSSFLALGSDPITGFPTGDLTTGFTSGPVAIPEPSTWSLMILILGCLFLKSRSARQNAHFCSK